MQVIQSSYQIEHLDDPQTVIQLIERAGRTCYRSDNQISNNTAENFIRHIIRKGHESVLEHSSMSVRFICSRQVSHELVRHRLCGFSQESTRYCAYDKDKFGNELTFIVPTVEDISDESTLPTHEVWLIWRDTMQKIETAYMSMRENGAKPQEAALILPNSLKTEIVTTANLREWRHIFKMRCSKAAHPQMRALMTPLLMEMNTKLPCLFEDIVVNLEADRATGVI